MPAFNKTTIEVIDVPDFNAIPDGLPCVFDSMSLAASLGIRNRTLMHLIVKRGSMYRRYTIPKKSGAPRSIHAPNKMLKFVQGRILTRYFDQLDYPEHISAYVPGRSTRESAEKHAGKAVLIVLDLKDFFTSTRRSWVRKAIQDQFGYSHNVSGLLADLMTVPMDFTFGGRYVVPQGSPTSGAVCNWVANHRLDPGVLKLCDNWGMTYTRYADDLAFTSEKPMARKETHRFIKEVIKTVKQSRYTVNYKKLRVARAGRQQRLLGMTINEKPNIMRSKYKQMRARLHHCYHKGFETVAKEMGFPSGAALESRIDGHLSYYHMINPDKTAKLKEQLRLAREKHYGG